MAEAGNSSQNIQHGKLLQKLKKWPLSVHEQICIFHKNREISILTMKKKTARPTLPQEATERSKQGETKNKMKNEKHTPV
jgi:hypothetical protein